MNIIHFNAGNPIHSFDELSRVAWDNSQGQFGQYPESIALLTDKAFKEVLPFLKAHKLSPIEVGDKPSQNMCFSYGVTHAFHQTMSVIFRQASRLNQARRDQNLSHLQPAIIAPVPTYTFLFDGLNKMGGQVIPVSRNMHDNWSLSPNSVAETLENIRREQKFLVVGYYDNNPNNPTGRIRKEEETSVLADVFEKHNAAMNLLDKRVFGSECQPQTGETHRIKIIEDMVYWGTELALKHQTASFINNAKTSKDSIVLLGLSKWGLPGMRAALIISHQSVNRHIFKHFYASCNYAPHPSFVALGKGFSSKPEDVRRREQHLSKLNDAHRYGLLLLRTLISGTQQESPTSTMLDRMVEDVGNIVGNRSDALRILNEGIPEIVPASTFPEAGFFQLLNFNSLIGRTPVAHTPGLSEKRREKKISGVKELNILFESFGVRFLKGSVVGLSGNAPIMRANAGLSPREIIEGMRRVKTAIQHLRF